MTAVRLALAASALPDALALAAVGALGVERSREIGAARRGRVWRVSLMAGFVSPLQFPRHGYDRLGALGQIVQADQDVDLAGTRDVGN